MVGVKVKRIDKLNKLTYIVDRRGKVYKVISGRNFLAFFVSIIIVLMFRSPIESLLSETVVKYGFSQISSIRLNDLIVFIIAVYSILLTKYRFRNYITSWRLTGVIVSLTFVYLFYRITEAPWDFVPFSFSSHLKYADVLFLICVFQVLLHVPMKKEVNRNNKSSFFNDEPISSEKKDLLGYNLYADEIGNKVLSTHFDKSFAIGINGKWGIGKSSFINLLKVKIKGDNLLTIDFNPWNSHSEQAIIKDFFETLQEEIRPYHTSLSRLLIQYSNKLVTLNSNTVTQTIQTTVSALTGFESLSSLYVEIDKALKSINKKIVIYIDDLDRLDRQEIIEVIRLIRNTASFYNTCFVVAYDKNYVISALHQYNSYKPEEFLEKIFQIEITLPFFEKEILRHTLARKLKERLPLALGREIDERIIGTAATVPIYLNEWLESMRDVTRLSNALILNLSKLGGEVDFNDLMRIELLRVKYPSVYELLHRRTADFLAVTSSDHSGNEQHYQLKTFTKEEGQKFSGEMVGCKTQFEFYLKQHQENLSLPKNAVSRIVNYVDGIFGRGYGFIGRRRSHLSVIFPSKFNRYFSYSLPEGNLSEVEFGKARILRKEDFNSRISEWVEKGLEFELKSRFSEVKQFDNREDFENVINAIFHLANLKTKQPRSNINIVGYDGEDLKNKLTNYHNILVEKFYPGPQGYEKLRNFVKGFFHRAESPYLFEAEFLNYLDREMMIIPNEETSNGFPLKKNELRDFCINYLRRYCTEVNEVDTYLWHLFYCCRQTEWHDVGGNTYTSGESLPEEAKGLIKDFILKKDFDGFLVSIIHREPFKQMRFNLNQVVLDVFGDWASFENDLNNVKEDQSSYLVEFKEFLTVYAAKNYSQYVDFNFKIIPVVKK